ncbi:MAG: DegT/DnrJ/EryC1/StrS family aminotransferase [Nanoarchaeota archaeon]
MEIPFIDLRKQYHSIKDEIDRAINKVLENTSFVLGAEVDSFEDNFARFCNSKYAIGVNSGTAALHLALLASNIGKGDEVITAPNSFFATAEAISLTGATPTFVDINERSYNMDPLKIEKIITDKTKAIIPVHLYGQTADMKPILEIAEKHNLKIIEDACQAHGSRYNGKRGTLGESACFSFYPGKNLGAYGEAGAVVTNDEKIANKIKLLRAHGEAPKNTHSIVGYNYRMEGIQGAILNVKLNYLDKWNNERREHARLYNELLQGKVIIPEEFTYHVYHLYVVRHVMRDGLRDYLSSKGIATGIHYTTPIHLQPAYKNLGYKEGSFPIVEKVTKEIISLPMFPEMTEEQINFVSENIENY